MQRGAHLAAPLSTLYPSSRWLLIPLSPKHTFLTEKKLLLLLLFFPQQNSGIWLWRHFLNIYQPNAAAEHHKAAKGALLTYMGVCAQSPFSLCCAQQPLHL